MINTDIFMAYLYNTILHMEKEEREQTENEIMHFVTDKESRDTIKIILDLTKNIQIVS